MLESWEKAERARRSVPKTIYLLRREELPCWFAPAETLHTDAEGVHNVPHAAAPDEIPDPRLTAKGRLQCKELHSKTVDLQNTVDMIVTSPLRRTMETCLIGFETAINRLGKENVVVLPELQEINGRECGRKLTEKQLISSRFKMPMTYAPRWTN